MAIVDAAAAAAQLPVGMPVLFIDTCSLLDILRIVAPRSVRERAQRPIPEIDAARRVLAAARTHPGKVALFIAEVVLAEWRANQPGVLEKVVAHIASVEEEAARIAACALSLGLSDVAAPKWHNLRVPHCLLEIANGMLGEATVIKETPSIRLAAYEREVKGTGPARRGKQCIKDCTIAESLLRFSEELRPMNPADFVFLTSNKEDFSNGGSKPHDDLQGDFARLAIQLSFNWGMAAHSLNL